MSNYIINYSEPLKTTIEIIPGGYNGPGGVSSASSLRLYGRGALEWGESVDENMLRLAENFSGSAFPVNPLNGQIHNQSVIYWRQGTGPAYTWWVFDVNAAPGTGTWSIITAPSYATAPAGVEGEYYYNTVDLNLYRWYSVYGQLASAWISCAYHRGTGIDFPNDGVDFPAQNFYNFNGYTVETSEVLGWQPLNTTYVNETAPASASDGTIWYTKSTGDVKIYDGVTWNVLGGYTAYADYDMQSTHNITNLPEQCGSPLGAGLETHWAATVGFVQCYVAANSGAGSYLPLSGGTVTGKVYSTTDNSASNELVTRAYVDSIVAPVGYTPIGTIITMPVDIDVPGYVKCDGTTYTKALFPDLFDLLVTNQEFDLVDGVSIDIVTGLVTSPDVHNLTQNSRVRFCKTGLNTGSTTHNNIKLEIDYYAEPASASTFYISESPDGPRSVPSAGCTGLMYRQSLYGFGTMPAVAYSPSVILIEDINNITHFQVPYMNGAFVRGWGAADALHDNTDVGRQIGTYQKASMLYGDNNNNSVNCVDRVNSRREYIGWDSAPASNYHVNDSGATPITGNGGDLVYNNSIASTHMGVARPSNLSMVYYIKAYDSDNVADAVVDVSTLISQVADMQVQLDSVVTTTKASATATYSATQPGGLYTFSHGLPSVSYVSVFLECLTADRGYIPGDRVYLPAIEKVHAVYVSGNTCTFAVHQTASSPAKYKPEIQKKGDPNSSWSNITDGYWSVNIIAYSEIGGA